MQFWYYIWSYAFVREHSHMKNDLWLVIFRRTNTRMGKKISKPNDQSPIQKQKIQIKNKYGYGHDERQQQIGKR